MSKVIINDFLMKLGFDGKEVSKGLHQLEGRINAMNKNIQKAQKATLKGEKEHINLLQKKQDLKYKTARAEQSQLNLSKKAMANKGKELDLQIKLGRLDKISLDIESKRLKILQQKKMLKGNILVKNQQILRAKEATAEAERRSQRASEKHANSAQRVANSSQRTSRSSKATSNHLRDSVASANKLQNFLIKGALAYGAFTTGRSLASSLLDTGMASSRAQVGMDAVAGHIAPMLGIENKNIGQFKEDQKNFVQNMAVDLNRDVVAVQETWRNMLGASINITEKHGAEGFNNIKDIFTGITKASSIFKLDSTQTKLMFLGVTQSLQKGKLQAEEVIRQISERSPLAIGQLVKAIRTVRGDMSITEKDMYDLMRNGELLAYDILPEWGRNLAKMAESLAGKDGLSAFMQKSAAGAWDGVVTALQSIKVGMFEEMDRPLARMLTTVKELLLNLEFVWQPMSVWFSNVFDLANEDLKKFLETAKKGTGAFSWVGEVFGFTGGSDNWEETKANMTPEKLRANSEAMFARSKKFYEGVRGFLVGDKPESGEFGGFLGGVSLFFRTVTPLVKQLADVLSPAMEKLGLKKGDESPFSSSNIGMLAGIWTTSNLTGATSMFISMATAFAEIPKAMASIKDLVSDPKTAALIGLLTNAVTGDSTPVDMVSRSVDIVTDPNKGIASKGVGLTQVWVAEPLTDKVHKSTEGVVKNLLPKGSQNFLSGTGGFSNILKSDIELKSNSILKDIFGTSSYNERNIGMGWALAQMRLDKSFGSGMTSQEVFKASATNRASYGTMFDGLPQSSVDSVLKGELMIKFMKDGEISREELVQLSNQARQLEIDMSPTMYGIEGLE